MHNKIEHNQLTDTENEIPRKVPALITYLHPFRIIESTPSSMWEPTIEQVNSGNWDYIKLHELVGGIDVGLATPYYMAIGFDGALALPPIPELRSMDKAVEFFNKCLAALLLGGIYCEAVTADHVETGEIFDWKYIRARGQAKSFVNQFHYTARMKMTPPIHAIELMHPRRLLLNDLIESANKGRKILELLPELSPEFLLKGTTSIARHDWTGALTNLWIVVEQLTAHLWKKGIIVRANEMDNLFPGRKDQLSDNRTWSISTKQEMLLQLGIIKIETLKELFIARKARNDLVHQGKHPDKRAALVSYNIVKAMLQSATDQLNIPLFTLDLNNHALTDPFSPRTPKSFEPKYWMEIPKLPGEAEFEKEEAMQYRKKSRFKNNPEI